MADRELEIKYVLGVVDRGARNLLQVDRQVRDSLLRTDRVIRDQAQTSTRSSEKIQRSGRTVTASLRDQEQLGKQLDGVMRGLERAYKAAGRDQTQYAAGANKVIAANRRIEASQKQLASSTRTHGVLTAGTTIAASRAAGTASTVAAASGSRIQTSSGRPGGGTVAGAGAASAAGADGQIGVQVAAAGAATGLVAAVKAAATFEKQLSSLKAGAGATDAQLAALRDSALKAGAATAYSATEAATAQTELAKGGMSVSDILKGGLTSSLSLAAAGELELADAASITSNAMGLFGLKGEDAGKVADALAVAAASTTADVADFGMALSQGGSVARIAGADFNETVTVLEALAKAGIKNSDAGTSLKSFFLNIATPSKKAAAEMKGLGVEIFTAGGKLKSMPAISENLRGAFGKLSKEAFLSKAGNIAGSDAIRTLYALYKAGPDQLRGFEKAQKQVGYANDVAATKQDNFLGSLDKLKGGLSTVGIAVGTPLLKPLRTATDAMADFFSEVESGKGLGGKVAGAVGTARVNASQAISAFRNPDANRAAPRTALGQHAEAPVRARTAAQGIGSKARELFDDKVLPTLKKIGTGAIEVGKQLVDAFKPAQPFLENVIIPLLKGIAIGVIGSIVGAFKLAVPIIKIIATGLGALGKVMAPLKPVIQGIGVVIGYVFGGPILGAIGKLTKFGGVVGGIGRVAKVLGNIITGLGLAIGKVVKFVGGAVGALAFLGVTVVRLAVKFNPLVAAVRFAVNKIPSLIRSVAGSVGRAASAVGGAVLSGIGRVANVGSRIAEWFGKIPGRVEAKLSGLRHDFKKFGTNILNSIISGIRSSPGAIAAAIRDAAGGRVEILGRNINPLSRRGGGRIPRFADGGLVPSLVSPGEEIHYGGRVMTVPGAPVAADNVFMGLPPGAAVITGDGQRMMAAGASLSEALASQLPHFREGGHVGDVVSGRASTFGPPLEKAGTTALGVSSGAQGVAVRPGAGFATGRPYLGGYWRVQIAGHTAILRQTDIGPHERTGRRIDVTGAGAIKLGLNPKSFPTDKIARATFLGDHGSTAALKRKRKGAGGSGEERVPIMLGASRRRAGLVDDALGAGISAGAAGLSRAEIAAASRGERGARSNPLLAMIREAQTATQRTVKTGGSVASDVAAGGTGRIGRMIARGNQISGRNGPYVYGGGHGRLGAATNGGFDCSGLVSALLGVGGFIRAAMTTDGLKGFGKSGSGRFMSIGVRGSTGRAAHTMIALRPRANKPWNYFESGSGHGARRVSGWSGNFPIKRHVAGYRAGGLVGERFNPRSSQFIGWGLRTGGFVGVGMPTPSPGRRLARAARTAGNLTGGSLEALDVELGRATQEKIEALRAQVARAVRGKGSKKVIQRLQSMLDLIDGETGRRIGILQSSIEQGTNLIAGRNSILDRKLRLQGVDASSAAGLNATMSVEQLNAGTLGQNRARAQAALVKAQATGNRTVIRDAQQAVKDADDAIAENFTRRTELFRDALRAAALEKVNASQFTLDNITANQALTEAGQRVRGATDSVGGKLERANIISGQVGPALLKLRDDFLAQAQVAASTGDVAGWRSAILAATSSTTDYANAQADAAELVRDAGRQGVQELVDAADFTKNIDDLGLERLRLEQKLAGTDGSTSSNQQISDYIRNVLVPDIDRELSAAQLKLEKLQSEPSPDAVLIRETMLSVGNLQNDRLAAIADATEATKTATEQTADNTGSLATEYRGAPATDSLEGFGLFA